MGQFRLFSVTFTMSHFFRIIQDADFSNGLSKTCIVMEYMAKGNLREYVQNGEGTNWLPIDMILALLSIR